MCGAKGARILTEINRLTQHNPPQNGEIAAPLSPLVTPARDPSSGSPPFLPAVLFLDGF